MTSALLISIFVTIVGATTPLLLAAAGELVVEKSGVLNLGVEGMMLLGAVAAFAVAFLTGSAALAIAAAAAAGLAASMVFAVLTLGLAANQVATGLALTLFGVGLSALAGESFVGAAAARLGPLFGDALAQHPTWRLVFAHNALDYFAIALPIAIWLFLSKTRWGLILRAIGENDVSAHALGYRVLRFRLAAVAFGGACAGLAGACFSLAITPMWAEELTAGRGWIALALVVFSGWRPARLLLGAYLFGALTTLELHVKAAGLGALAPELLAAAPYLATIAVLAALTARERIGRAAPACLGRPFDPSR